MAGIALLLDLLKKNPSFQAQTLHSYGLFSATVAASAAAASVAAGRPLASRFLFGDGGTSIAFCDAGPAWNGDYINNLQSASKNIFKNDSIKYSTKEYPIELKPLFSAFGWKSLGITTLRSFLLFYLPLLEPRSPAEDDDDDDDDFLHESSEEREPVDLVVPFKKSMKQIIRETSIVTTRRLLERLAVHYTSRRMAWKLLKDVPKSAMRKAERGMPTLVFFYSVSRTTFRGHLLGVVAAWLVQVGIETYRLFSNESENEEEIDKAEKVQIFKKKVAGATARCCASLVFASIGAGLGACLFRPSTGQWIGCAVGDLAGPIIVSLCTEKSSLRNREYVIFMDHTVLPALKLQAIDKQLLEANLNQFVEKTISFERPREAEGKFLC